MIGVFSAWPRPATKSSPGRGPSWLPKTSRGAPAPSPSLAPAIPPVRLLIVAQPGHAQAFYAAFAAAALFAVQVVATSPDDARAKLTLEPEAVVVEVVVFSGPPEFANTFAAYRGAAFAIVPANLGASLADAVRQVPCVLRVAESERTSRPRPARFGPRWSRTGRPWAASR